MDLGTKEEAGKSAPPLSHVLWSFLKIGGSAFGGSTQALIFREAVDNRKWLTEQEFLTGQALSQVLPGANPVNIALYVGLRVRGGIGAIVAVFGMIIPAFMIIMAMGYAYRQMSGLPVTHFVLGGVAAAGIGATLSMGFKIARKLPRDLVTYLIGFAVFLAIGVLQLPMIPVVLFAVPLSIALAYFGARRTP